MIIDTFSGLADRRVLGSWLRAFVPFEGYVRMFAKKMSGSMGISPGQLVDAVKTEGIDAIVEKMMDGLSDSFMDLDSYVGVLDALKVKAQGVWLHIDPGDIMSQPAVVAAAEAVERFPDRFFLLPSFKLSDDLPGRVEDLHVKVNIAGVTTLAFIDNKFPDDKAWYPLYEKLDELGLVLWNHTVNSWSDRHLSEIGHPRCVDRIACDYPNLKIVMGHGGYPWIMEAVTVARRHRNVYLEPSSHRWKHLSRQGSGWEPLMYYGDWAIAHKVLFASMWQLQGLPLFTVIDEAKGLPLSEKTIRKWMYENAAGLYGIK